MPSARDTDECHLGVDGGDDVEVESPDYTGIVDIDKADIRSKLQHFRVLVIGRINAGKTTLLKKLTKSPELFDSEGRKVPHNSQFCCSERGLDGIDNQLASKSNPKFVFHDSRGFQWGSVDELERVKVFIAERASRKSLSEQLHVIWYCLPTDTYETCTEDELQVFNTDLVGIGKPPILRVKSHTNTLIVPIILIFTKFDGLVDRAYVELRDEMNRIEAMRRETERAQEMLTTLFIEPFMSMRFPPSALVRLDDMRKETSNCNELIGTTINTLSDDVLRAFFVSVQQNNIDFCICCAVQE
ncbi:hypothetical protein GGX14DRAFT_382885 [Mycena pura]|uniref:G domain-containing protein n=1 Tax=Mycena pura TaxID=153505 RepID=A0AAD6UP03_9AGAR|nr:hypothetical protein GGX14DRAFT_382885 [Mycena pura]